MGRVLYLLDANVFIQAQRQYYNIDFCPGFWDWLVYANANLGVASIVGVKDEIAQQLDPLQDWTSKLPSNWFLTTDDQATQTKFAEIAQFVQTEANQGRYKPQAIPNFLGGADPWLIAKASTLGATVITQEVLDENAKKIVKIPNICSRFKVGWMNTFELLLQKGAKFKL